VAIGSIHPEKVIRNTGARSGDVLILTKPIGTGILSTALKRGLIDAKTKNYLVTTMTELNASAAAVMAEFPVHACTDITGFGLLGHLHEMTVGSRVRAQISTSAVPVLPFVKEMIRRAIIPGGTDANREFVNPYVLWDTQISKTEQVILCDAQTSGGLLIALPREFSDEILQKLHSAGVSAATKIGQIVAAGDGKIQVVH